MIRGEYRWVAALPADVLNHLRAIARDRCRPRFRDPEAAANELAAMLELGNRPALGWWRRHLDRQTPAARRPSSPATYGRVLEGMVASGLPRRIAEQTVAQLASEDGVELERVVAA